MDFIIEMLPSISKFTIIISEQVSSIFTHLCQISLPLHLDRK